MLRELPNLICLYRFCFCTILAICIPDGFAVAILYSIGFISDLFDGFFYRMVNEHPNHWFNRLPISMDPIADFAYGIGGLVYAARKGQSSYWLIIVVVILCLGGNLLLLKTRGITWMIIANFLTYGFFAVMVYANFLIWKIAGLKQGFTVTMIVFYLCYVVVGDPKRLVRRNNKEVV